MRILYNLGIAIYSMGVRAAAACGHTKAKQMCAGWKKMKSELLSMNLGKGTTAWFHASSLGEFEQARPVIEALKKEHPEYKIVVTFFSPSGYEIRKNYDLADYICYLPMDTPGNAKRFVATIQPQVVYFVKYDFWYNYMRAIKDSGAQMYIFSTIFRPNQYFFKWYGGWFRKQLKLFDHLFVQNQESLQLLKKAGIEQCSIAGDTRFDRVHDITMAAKEFKEIEAFADGKPVVMAGSSWEPDEAQLKQYLDNTKVDLKLIVAPHMIHEEHLQKIEALFGKENCVRFTRLTPKENYRQILIIDTMGMLSAMYRYATVAYIGGGFGQGIHNILEALTFGKPVVFGPRYQKFQEAHDIIALGGGKSYNEQTELKQCLDEWLCNNEQYTKASQTCKDYVEGNLGAAKTILGKK